MVAAWDTDRCKSFNSVVAAWDTDRCKSFNSMVAASSSANFYTIPLGMLCL
jgi:hypothetical protein